MRALTLTLAVLLLVGGCSTAVTTALDQAHRPTTPAPVLKVVPDTSPPSVTGVQRGSCLAGDNGSEPDPACTPGAVAGHDESVVCAPRFESRHRASTGSASWTHARQIAMVAYGVPERDYPRVQYDHRIPASLDGANDTSNLWPEVSDKPGSTSSNTKDVVETTVWRAVCGTHTVKLADAQRAFTGDWRTALAVLKIPVATPLPHQ